MSSRPLVPIIYHSFPHYRDGVNRELMKSSKYEFLFVGAPASAGQGTGIEVWNPPAGANFLATRNCYPIGRPLFQSRVVGLSLRRDISAMIFLGCAEFATTWIAAAIARLAGKQVYFWTHGWIAPDHGLKRLSRLAFYRLANKLLLYGHHAKTIGIRNGFRASDLHVIYNSLDYEAQVAARDRITEEDILATRASLFARPELPLLLCTGRLVAYRRLHVLLEAMRCLRQQGFPVNLLLIGEGPERASLESFAKHHELNLNIYGACYDEMVLSRLIMSADLTVVPGRVGLTAIHSMTYGTPVLVHDNPSDQGPEWDSIIQGFNGQYYSHADESDLVRAIQAWFKSAPPRTQLRKNCQAIVEQFYTPAHQVRCIERALDGAPSDDSEWDAFCQANKTTVP